MKEVFEKSVNTVKVDIAANNDKLPLRIDLENTVEMNFPTFIITTISTKTIWSKSGFLEII